MLKVLPVQSKLKQEEICLRCGITYNPDLLAYSATVDENLAGVCQFRITHEGGIIYDLAPAPDLNDFEAMLVLGRGTLNFIDLCGVHKAFFEGKVTDEALIKAIGFSKSPDNNRYAVDLEGFFDEPCTKHKI